MIGDFAKIAGKSRMDELEAAIRGFYECGVTLDRITIVETPGSSGWTLFVDDIARAGWRLEFSGVRHLGAQGAQPI